MDLTTRKGREWNFNVGKGLEIYSTITDNKSKTAWRHSFFDPSTTHPYHRFQIFHRETTKWKQIILIFANMGTERLSKLAPITLEAWEVGTSIIICSFSFRPPSFSVMYYISLKSTYWRILFSGVCSKNLLNINANFTMWLRTKKSNRKLISEKR